MIYKYRLPPKGQKVHFLKVVSNKRPYLPAGSITWVQDKYSSEEDIRSNKYVLVEDNRHAVNFLADEFEMIPVSTEVQYRFKTKDEFIRDGLWDTRYDAPKKWESTKQLMNKFLGTDVPGFMNILCENNETLHIDRWTFLNTDYVEKEIRQPTKTQLDTIKVIMNGFTPMNNIKI